MLSKDIEIKKILDKLVEDKYLYSYSINGNEVVLVYGLSSVESTERVIILNGDLKQAILDSARDLKIDIESSLVGDSDFYGYDNLEDLENRIKEETEYLKLLGSLI